MNAAGDRKKEYRRKARHYAKAEAEERSRSDRMSNLRLTAFLAGVGGGIIGAMSRSSSPVVLTWFLLSAVAFGVFGYLVFRHRRILARRERFSRLRELNESAQHRLDRAWDEFPVPLVSSQFADQNISHDLDLFGAASAFQLICNHNTPQGRYLLAKWLTDPADPEELRKRQAAVEALSAELDWRQNLSVIGLELAVDEEMILPDWLKAPSWFSGKINWLEEYLRWCPWIFLALLVLFFVLYPFPGFVIALLFHIYLARKYRKQIDRSLKSLAGEERKLRSYAEVFAWLQTCPSRDGRLEDLKEAVNEAASAMDELNDLATRAAVRGSMVHPLLLGVSLWDFRVVRALESWQERYADHVTQWFTALGEFEALASLAGLHFDEPDWVFPEFKTEGAIEGDSLGHPLIAEDARVCNAVRVGPEGRFLLVTGSNMSGKSTLLRSVGLNVSLAQAGGPVCAARFALPKIAIATSMRVQDSLSDGVSFFMAELKRIKEVVLMAEQIRDRERKVLFLLDEILQGTNTVERREIVQRVIAHLVASGAIGAITTHDLALAEMDDLADHSDLVHFRESFTRDEDGKPQMTFDYQLREGIATTTNALKILEVIEMPV